jgi:8-amino-7-oxononanoate synthase
MTTWMRRRLDALEKRHLLRSTHAVEGGAEPWATLDGRRLLNLSSNNYLGLAGHPEVRAAAAEAAERYGAGAGASRLVSGTGPLHEALEQGIAGFKGTEAALLFNSGYNANVGVIPEMVGEGDVVIGDELNHASLIDGCRLSGASKRVYSHLDPDSLEHHLKAACESFPRGRRLVVTDTVFSMDGDLAPLPEITALCERYDAALMIDEAHGTGCLGLGGRGAAVHMGVEGRATVTMGTLSKALGGFGAFVAGESTVRQYFLNTARSFIFTTALPPAVVAAALAALAVLRREPELVCRLQENGGRLREQLRALGFDTLRSETQIVPVLVGESQTALEFARCLRDEGVYAVPIRPPAVPVGKARVRASVMASHSGGDLSIAVEAFGRAGRKVGLV